MCQVCQKYLQMVHESETRWYGDNSFLNGHSKLNICISKHILNQHRKQLLWFVDICRFTRWFNCSEALFTSHYRKRNTCLLNKNYGVIGSLSLFKPYMGSMRSFCARSYAWRPSKMAESTVSFAGWQLKAT